MISLTQGSVASYAIIAGAAAALGYAFAQRVFSKKKASLKPVKVGVGIGVVLQSADGQRVLVGLRKGSHGSGQWALPGGWLERGEEFETGALRELGEETNVFPENLEKSATKVINMLPCNNPEFGSISVFVQCRLRAGQEDVVRVCEPEKCYEWRWIKDPSELGEDAALFRPLPHYFRHRPKEA
mmetsp:Transcript_3247/g.7296  ORF Transcript_3247/g.7296 Transcript_3247/m.7296 type:complete len:184 (+) Transcript_3247:217-768(+)|eukprot:CAMPEP_0171492438 /NCGR_PEP_ID=MMETSP0958-20121227/4410_1 /TAXON_ID=87120 /ORGANISM="Aurantiochytrium limacinum, Strain ATCCMYA-1381" /LENGTH=183 /DNA_ID=CAMNT_0012025957 /DNA_START=224 /DNA_END=775 /DNA_ORIENTATION=+